MSEIQAMCLSVLPIVSVYLTVLSTVTTLIQREIHPRQRHNQDASLPVWAFVLLINLKLGSCSYLMIIICR